MTRPRPAAESLPALRDSSSPGVLILLYHRVTKLEADPQLLAVHPDQFAQHLEVIRATARPLSLGLAAKAIVEKRVSPAGIVLTFDDGYADNLTHAKPLLEQFDIPATVFVATGIMGTPSEFWWDELEQIVFAPGPLPPLLRLTVCGGLREWELGAAADYSAGQGREHAGWTVLADNDPTPRHTIYRSLCGLLGSLSAFDREAALDEIRRWAGRPRQGRCSRRAMTPEEVARLAAGGLVEVGSHGVTHTRFAAMTEQLQQWELQESRRVLRTVLGKDVTSVSYPFGTRKDFSPATARIAVEAGYTCACANFRGIARAGSDLFQLPRFIVRDWDGDDFARRIEEQWARG